MNCKVGGDAKADAKGSPVETDAGVGSSTGTGPASPKQQRAPLTSALTGCGAVDIRDCTRSFDFMRSGSGNAERMTK